MATILLSTRIYAPIATCFDVSRSIDLHIESMQPSNETAIAGVTSGLIELGETVTWRAKHFSTHMQMTVVITAMQYPDYFIDEMQRGPFKSMKHLHEFEQKDGYVLMKDRFEFESPLGILGKLVNFIFLKGYMQRLLAKRNEALKAAAEKQPLQN